MSDLGFTRSDLRSIRAATQQPEFADAVQGRLSANGYPLPAMIRPHLWRALPPAASWRRASCCTTTTGMAHFTGSRDMPAARPG
jgi:hypothetical protein